VVTWVVALVVLMLAVHVQRRLGEIEAEQAGILKAIDVRRAERLKQDQELCAWLLRWSERAHQDIDEMKRVTGEFRAAVDGLGGGDVN